MTDRPGRTICEVQYEVRPFRADDAAEWVRCRTLGFLDSAYFDDVKREPTAFELPAVRMVAERDDRLIGLIDVEIDGSLATIDSIAVLPEARRHGTASRLLQRAASELPANVVEIDAWTRDDAAANSWYRHHGFTEEQHYLHVYRSWNDRATLPENPAGMVVVSAFMHASIEREADLRESFARVHVCRRYVRPITVG